MNGQVMQKKLPAASKAITASPRQCVHGRTPARFIGLSGGPSNPSAMMSNAIRNIAVCATRRKCGQRRIAPTPGARRRSNAGARAKYPLLLVLVLVLDFSGDFEDE